MNKRKRRASALARRRDALPSTARAVEKVSRSSQLKGVTRLAMDVGALIESSQGQVLHAANAALTALYWRIGTRIRRDVLKHQRAEYGAAIVSELGQRLEREYGRGFAEKSLRHMMRFAESFPDEAIVSTLWRQLAWSQLRLLSYIDEPLKREFYTELCRLERWSVRTLEDKLQKMLYERTALSKRPAELIRKELKALRTTGEISPAMVFKDPYLLSFLGLEDAYSEKDLEDALLREIQKFILELGSGFAFIERQKRITLDGQDFYIDLLFFHRRLKRLVLIELKLGDFRPADAGQVKLYLSWLNRHERHAGEAAPIALILCAGKNRETVEYLDLDRENIHVAEYVTQLPPRKVLERRFQAALAAARAQVSVQVAETA
jgi:predicted nuclease of restriction endonuclease-like (RecB) superfamily